MKRLQWLVILMVITLLIISGFQAFWLHNNYEREAATLHVKTNAMFKQAVEELQAAHLRFDTIKTARPKGSIDKNHINTVFRRAASNDTSKLSKQAIVRLTNSFVTRFAADTSGAHDTKRDEIVITFKTGSSFNINDSVHRRTMRLDTLNPAMISRIFVMKGNEGRDSNSHQNIQFRAMHDFNATKVGPDSVLLPPHKSQVRIFTIGKEAKNANHLILANKLKAAKADYDFVYRLTSPLDSLPISELSNSYRKKSLEKNLNVPFSIFKSAKKDNAVEGDNEVIVGLDKQVSYRLDLGNAFPYLIKKISVPILFSLFLVAVTLLSFTAFYVSLVKQQKLAEVKNDFISNVTHELKTPIATVSVAIEALRNFNALHDKERTKEYLDISEGELNRLSLLVDKVLKFSMLEQNKIELQFETVSIESMVKDVVVYLKMQLEKAEATVTVKAEGNTEMSGDFIHLQSVIFNLLDNAIKYSGKKPLIEVDIKGTAGQISLVVKDHGPGIAEEYVEKVFEKFFRVPNSSRHNVKGYGLGLSYVASVVRMHKGTIHVQSNEGSGCSFIINFPS